VLDSQRRGKRPAWVERADAGIVEDQHVMTW